MPARLREAHGVAEGVRLVYACLEQGQRNSVQGFADPHDFDTGTVQELALQRSQYEALLAGPVA